MGKNMSCPPVTLFVGLLRVSSGFLSSLEDNHLIIRDKTQQTDKKKRKAQATGTHAPRFPPEKEKTTITPAFQSDGSPPFPPRSNCLFFFLPFSLSSGLRLACRKSVFGAVGAVEVLLSVCVSTRSLGEEGFPPGLNPRPRSSSGRRWFVESPRFGDTAVRLFRNPYQPMVIRANPAPDSSLSLPFSPCKYIHRTISRN